MSIECVNVAFSQRDDDKRAKSCCGPRLLSHLFVFNQKRRGKEEEEDKDENLSRVGS